jgi:hypothetical protein
VISWHKAGLTIGEGPAKRDPANTQWQVDVAVSCAQGLLLSIQERQNDRCQDLRLLMVLKQAGRLHANQDWSGWFDNSLHSLK